MSPKGISVPMELLGGLGGKVLWVGGVGHNGWYKFEKILGRERQGELDSLNHSFYETIV